MIKGYIIEGLSREKKKMILNGLRGATGIKSAAVDVAGGMLVVESKKDLFGVVKFAVENIGKCKLRTEMKQRDLRESMNRIPKNEYEIFEAS